MQHQQNQLVKILARLACLFRAYRERKYSVDAEYYRSDAAGKPVCGGYNEAFIMQNWSIYTPYR